LRPGPIDGTICRPERPPIDGADVATLLMIDNFDSFTYNLVPMFRRRGLDVVVRRSDAIDETGARELAPDYLVIGPGPGAPAQAPLSCRLITSFAPRIPTLGVCLGMQCLNEVHGGRTVRCAPVHGKTTLIEHDRTGLFAGLPTPLRVARYHSLAVVPSADALNDELAITARAADDVIMGLAHRRHPLHGVQFHPESFLTDHGDRLIDNFLALGPAEAMP
jgi:anthranilate synthase component 2